jgi:hypothetical protein
MSVTLKIAFHGSEYLTCHNHLFDATSSLFLSRGSHMFIKNSEPNGIVDSQTLSHSANKVIFLKSALNHIYLSSSSLFWIESYHWY